MELTPKELVKTTLLGFVVCATLFAMFYGLGWLVMTYPFVRWVVLGIIATVFSLFVGLMIRILK